MGQIWWVAHQPGERINIRSVFVSQSVLYSVWIPVTVLVWRITRGWDPSTLGWWRFAIRFVALFVVVGAAQSAAYIGLSSVALRAWTTRVPGPFLRSWTNYLTSSLYVETVVYAAIVGTGQAIIMYGRWRERERQAVTLQAELSEARLETLRAQLHPHFLFNSLHTIASLVRDNRNADAVRLISGLSDLLRRVLNSKDATIALEEEVELARRYLEIQDARFGDRIHSSIEVDPSLAGARVPALVIQPLLENAIRHGLSSRVEGGSVSVRVSRQDGAIRIVVADTGVGVPPDWSIDRTTGTGLRNLRARLEALYGSAATLHAAADAGGGFRVDVTLPFPRA